MNYYFKKRRALATGLGVCGSGIGVVIFGPITRFLIDLYTWRGAILVQGGLLLHGVLCGLVYRPIETKGDCDDISVESIVEYDNEGKSKVESFKLKHVSEEIRECGDDKLDENEIVIGDPMNKRVEDVEMLYMPTKDNKTADLDKIELDFRDVNKENVENHDSQTELNTDHTNFPDQNEITTTSNNKKLYPASVSAPSNRNDSSLLNKDINETYALSTEVDVDSEAHSERLEAEKVLVCTVKENCHYANPDRYDNGDQATAPGSHGRNVAGQNNTNRLVRAVKKNFDFSIFRSVPFLLQMFATALYTFTYLTPYVFLPDKARQIGRHSNCLFIYSTFKQSR